MEAVANKEEPLTLKSLQSHLIKAFVGAIGGSLLVAMISSYAFYINTNNNFDTLNQNKVETKLEVSNLKRSVEEIKNSVSQIQTSISNTGIYTSTNKEQIKSLDERITNIERGQTEMLKVLYEIKSRQR